MSDFGDYEPEDAWHPEDSLAEQLTNLVRRVELLARRQVRIGATDPVGTLDAIAKLVAQERRRRLSDRELIRARDLDEDIIFIRGRL